MDPMTENVPSDAVPESGVSETAPVTVPTRTRKRTAKLSANTVKRATRKKGTKKTMQTQTRSARPTRSARTPRFATQVLNAARALLRTPEFVAVLRGAPAVAAPTARRARRVVAPVSRRRTLDPVRSYARAARGASSNRGRIAGTYHPHTGVKATTIKKESASTQRVFAVIARNSRKGITQKQIQDTLSLPHSTVWYALKSLRALKSVDYRSAE